MHLKAQTADLRTKTNAADPVISIRRAESCDARRLAVLMSQLGYPTREDEMAVRLRRILPFNDYRVAVAVRDELVVGVIAAHIGLHIEMNGPYGQVTALSVAEGHRGQGIGALLVAHAESWLQSKGAVVCIVNSSHRRAGAHRFYEREGYRATGLRFYKNLKRVEPAPPSAEPVD
jgi:GNAT superfamily N-acetyltransferase